MTPAARLAASIELLAAINDGPRRPADAVANEFFSDGRAAEVRAVGAPSLRALCAP